MDVNQTPFWLAAEQREFDLAHASGVAWSERARGLALAPADRLRLPARDRPFAMAAWAAARPRVLDGFAQLAFLSDDRRALLCDVGGPEMVGSALPPAPPQPVVDEELVPIVAPAGEFVDVALGGESLLALAWRDAVGAQSGLLAFDLCRRTVDRCALPGVPRRVLVAPDRRCFIATDEELLIVAGGSLPQPYVARPARFEPTTITPHPLAVTARLPLPPRHSVLALAHDGTHLFVLSHDDLFAQQLLVRRLVDGPDAPFTRHPLPAAPLPFVIDAAAFGPRQLALLAPRRPEEAEQQRDALLVGVPERDGAPAEVVPRRHPLRELADARFVGGGDGVVRYPAHRDPTAGRVRPAGVRELVALPLPRRALEGKVELAAPIDSGRLGCVWHRLYLDGCLPEGTRLVVHAAASDLPDRPGEFAFEPQPPPTWCALPSELPFAAPIAAHESDRSGTFELLLQREGGAVRRLAGRFLWLRLELHGDGRATPLLHALRVYGPRFSWQEHYLPELFRHEEAAAPSPTSDEERRAARALEPNGADFRERWLANFEGLLTPIEGRIAAAEQLLDPESAPAAVLPHLASFLGAPLDPSWPVERQRRSVAAAGELALRRGTLPAVRLALDIATDGLVARGAIVVIENFRLRRTLATLLGVNLDDAGHPLTLGTMESGNSIVGDSLILSAEAAREFLALYDPAALSAGEAHAAAQFLERHAHKVTVLLHGPARERRAVVEQVLLRELPAHLQWELFATERPFVPGLAPLLAVDTWIDRTPPPRGVVLDDTWLSREGLLLDVAAFAPSEANANPGRRRPREEI
ncbi:MAG: phage tail protein [Planctomycetes bacterium]|nr:phage tail protein [Planctomycetota bacterium]